MNWNFSFKTGSDNLPMNDQTETENLNWLNLHCTLTLTGLMHIQPVDFEQYKLIHDNPTSIQQIYEIQYYFNTEFSNFKKFSQIN